MKPYSGYKSEKKAMGREILPAGGYCAKILKAEEKTYEWGTVLLIHFDLTDAAYKEFFKKDYDAQPREDRKWRGNMRLYLPKDNGSEKDQWTKDTFNDAIWCIEDSNPGFHWAWDEGALKGKEIGVLFRDKEWAMDTPEGLKTGWTTECCRLASVNDIRSGNFKVPKKKPLPADKKAEAGFSQEDDDSDVPF